MSQGSGGLISYQPTPGLSYDPSEPIYWDKEALQGETTRAFEICHGCRMCFKYCDSFPTLFDLIDERYDGDVRKLTDEDTSRVMDGCFQCKLCEVQCPYTPRDKHEFQLDFPKLVHRHRAHSVRDHGLDPKKKLLADPDGAARLARTSLGLANVMNRTAVHRWFMEKFLGVHRDKLLPEFASETFEEWARANGRVVDSPSDQEAVLFQTCYVENNEPRIGRDTLEVLDHNEVSTGCVAGLHCCGMPAWDHGDLKGLQERAKANLDRLEPFVDAGAKVVAINPTCSMMLRREYPHLVADEDRERAAKVADAVRDPGEYLWSLRKEGRFKEDFKSSPGEIAYHTPCHLRTQGVGFKGRDLLRKIPGTTVGSVMECCGHDGTWAMTVDGFEASQRVGKKAFDGMIQQDTEVWATDCPLASLQFEQHAGTRPMHPMTVLAMAYRGDAFPGRKRGDGDE